jgi:hypothetical protein
MNVVNLTEYRKAQAAVKKQRCPDEDRYFCLRCETDAFKLYETGAIHCLNCGALMRNIRVAE